MDQSLWGRVGGKGVSFCAGMSNLWPVGRVPARREFVMLVKVFLPKEKEQLWALGNEILLAVHELSGWNRGAEESEGCRWLP